MNVSLYIVILLCFLSGVFGFVIAAILTVPRAPHLRSADEYLRESLKPFRHLFGQDIKDMQQLYDITLKNISELRHEIWLLGSIVGFLENASARDLQLSPDTRRRIQYAIDTLNRTISKFGLNKNASKLH